MVLLWAAAGPARGGVLVLNFSDLTIPGETDLTFFTPYQSQGFTLTSTNPPTGFSAGFQAHGSNSIFYAGARGLAAFAPAAPPDSVIELTRDGGLSFSLLSIDLARNFSFDPAPTVTFTGVLAGGGTVSQTFTVTTAAVSAPFLRSAPTGSSSASFASWVASDRVTSSARITSPTTATAYLPTPRSARAITKKA